MSGDWGPNKDLKDPHVIKIGQFAVNEYNIHSKSEQKFVNIVRGEFQVVSGVNYMLVVGANDGRNIADKMYKAVVLEQPWMKSMNITSFKPLFQINDNLSAVYLSTNPVLHSRSKHSPTTTTQKISFPSFD